MRTCPTAPIRAPVATCPTTSVRGARRVAADRRSGCVPTVGWSTWSTWSPGPTAAPSTTWCWRRADGVPAYNLAVVVDDGAQGVTQVVRGDDLLSSTPRQILLQRLLGFDPPEYLHVPLVLGADGQRLAKRHGAVTLADLASEGWTPTDVVAVLARSLGLAAATERRVGLGDLVDRFDPSRLPTAPIELAQLRGLRR